MLKKISLAYMLALACTVARAQTETATITIECPLPFKGTITISDDDGAILGSMEGPGVVEFTVPAGSVRLIAGGEAFLPFTTVAWGRERSCDIPIGTLPWQGNVAPGRSVHLAIAWDATAYEYYSIFTPLPLSAFILMESDESMSSREGSTGQSERFQPTSIAYHASISLVPAIGALEFDIPAELARANVEVGMTVADTVIIGIGTMYGPASREFLVGGHIGLDSGWNTLIAGCFWRPFPLAAGFLGGDYVIPTGSLAPFLRMALDLDLAGVAESPGLALSLRMWLICSYVPDFGDVANAFIYSLGLGIMNFVRLEAALLWRF